MKYSYIIKNLINFAEKHVGIKEKSQNSGPEIDKILSEFGVKKQPYCVYFVLYCWKKVLEKLKLKFPFKITGNSQDLYNYCSKLNCVYKDITKIKKGDIIIYRKFSTLSGHAGIIVDIDLENRYVLTIEGNTKNSDFGDQREGDGIYKRKRNISNKYFNYSSFYIRGFIDCKKLILLKNNNVIDDDLLQDDIKIEEVEPRPVEKPKSVIKKILEIFYIKK